MKIKLDNSRKSYRLSECPIGIYEDVHNKRIFIVGFASPAISKTDKNWINVGMINEQGVFSTVSGPEWDGFELVPYLGSITLTGK